MAEGGTGCVLQQERSKSESRQPPTADQNIEDIGVHTQADYDAGQPLAADGVKRKPFVGNWL
jgi:hypothetical protein